MSDPTKEQLNRIEHKLDLLLHHLPDTAVMLAMQDPMMHCPVCQTLIKYQPDPFGAGVHRTCGCHPGVHGVGIPEALEVEDGTPNRGPHGTQQPGTGDEPA